MKIQQQLTYLFLVILAALTTATGCSRTRAEEHRPEWKISKLQIFSEEGTCCEGAAAGALGLYAARDMAMKGNSLKIALGCRKAGTANEMGTIIELKVQDKIGATESFQNVRTDRFESCDDRLIVGATAIFQLLKAPVSVWEVTELSDQELCEMLARHPDVHPKPVLMRAIEELAQRKTSICLDTIEKLASRDDPDIAVRSVTALGRIGDRRAIMPLGKLSLSPIPQLPWAATQAIADIGGLEAARALDIIAGQSQTEVLAREAADLATEIRANSH